MLARDLRAALSPQSFHGETLPTLYSVDSLAVFGRVLAATRKC